MTEFWELACRCGMPLDVPSRGCGLVSFCPIANTTHMNLLNQMPAPRAPADEKDLLRIIHSATERSNVRKFLPRSKLSLEGRATEAGAAGELQSTTSADERPGEEESAADPAETSGATPSSVTRIRGAKLWV